MSPHAKMLDSVTALIPPKDVITVPAPDPTKLPGWNSFLELLSGGMGWGIGLAVAAIAGGGALWGVAKFKTENSKHEKLGLALAIGGVVGAILVGAAPTLANWAYEIGRNWK
ncbi:hypothetical protein ACFRJ9_21760 [Paenarthrobacter sp. NPDC056912]|uniref:hypothetical protein n=1 Tax=Paenarthrobacter sp. NPDC056912 TaxID=3345965 RepID=UPI0036715FD4